MSDCEGFKRKSTRTAAIEAAKRIKNNANANKLLSRVVKQEYQSDEAKMDKSFVVATTNNEVNGIYTRRVSNNTQGRKSPKGYMLDQVLDSTVFPPKAQAIRCLSNKWSKFVEAYPQKLKDMPKRGRGRPPKSQSAKYTFTSGVCSKYEDVYDLNERRESYNTSLLKSEASSPKQLQPGNGGITYKESLMKFCKGLGPTARKVALRKLFGQGLNYQIRHRLEPLLPTSEAQQNLRFLDMSSINGSVKNTKPNQVSQPLITFGRTDAIADYKGKTIMVDDGKNNPNKWNARDNLEFFFGKQNAGVKICNNHQDNAKLTGGDGLSENQDFVRKNLSQGQVGNWRTINQMDSFLADYNGNLNRNVKDYDGFEDVEVSLRNGNLNSCVYPSTYVQPSMKVSSSLLTLDDGVNSSVPWVPPTSAYCPPPVQPLQNWCQPSPETKNPVVNDGFWREQGLQLALASYMQMTDHKPNVWIDNSWAQNHPNQFPQPDPNGTYLQQARNVQPQLHQIQSCQKYFDSDVCQQQDGLLMPMQPQLWSQIAMSGAVPNQDSFPFSI